MRFLTIITFLLINLQLSAQEPARKISCHVNNISFDEFAKIVKSKSGLEIFYKSGWVEGMMVELDADSISAIDALKQVLEGSHLNVAEWNNIIVILPGEDLISVLPDFYYNELSTANDTFSMSDDEGQYLTGRSSDIIKSITVGLNKSGNTGWAEIKGKISDIENAEPIVGATVYINETRTGSVTDLHGILSLHIKPGKYTAQFDCMGYVKMSCQLIVISDGAFDVSLVRDIIPIDEAVVYGDRQMIITAKDPGIEKIHVKSIKELPMMFGERDILKVAELLPGIVSIGEGSSGLNVRGGNFDQNAFYINNVPVYNTSHLFGFFPAFNADVINDITIYKGHVPAYYGGKLSSVFKIDTRQGSRKQLSLQGGINPFSGNITISGPLISDSCTFLISGRTSYSDWILKRINDPLIQNSSAGFSDLTSSISYDLNKTHINAFFYQSRDRFRLSDLISYEYANLGTSLNVNHRINSSLQNQFSIIGAQYSYGTVDQQDISAAYKHSYQLQHYEIRNNINHIYNNMHTLNYGIDLIYYQLNRGTVDPYGPESLKTPVFHGHEQAIHGALYVSDIYNIMPWLKITAGFRISQYSYFGPKKVFQYQDENHKDPRLIRDTLDFKRGEVIKRYAAPEIRISLNVATDPNGSVKLSFNQMEQPLFMLSNTIALAPNTQWKLSDYYIKPSRGNQYSVGIFRTFPYHKIESSIEAFYKSTANFPEFRDGANFLYNPVIETEVLQGKQQSYGIEFFFKLDGRKTDVRIAYTYSRSLIKIDGDDIWHKINHGDTYPSNYDIPNSLNTILNYHFSKRVTVSSVLSYQTGRPVTYPVSVYYIEDQPFVDYSGRNKYRIPDYFRMDLSLNVEGNLKRNKLIHSSWQFTIYNLTDRNNAYSVYYASENGKLNSYKYSIIGTQLFTVSWLFKMGNFETDF